VPSTALAGGAPIAYDSHANDGGGSLNADGIDDSKSRTRSEVIRSCSCDHASDRVLYMSSNFALSIDYILYTRVRTRRVGIKRRHIEAGGVAALSARHPHPKSSSVFTMSFKLYGSPLSTATRVVALIAKERNIPYELVHIDLRGGDHKQPAYLAHNPFGQVPYITVRYLPSPSYICSISYAFSYSRVE